MMILINALIYLFLGVGFGKNKRFLTVDNTYEDGPR